MKELSSLAVHLTVEFQSSAGLLSNANVELDVSGTKLVLDLKGVESILGKLAEMRAGLRPEVPPDLEGVTVVAQVDPAWRTDQSLHPGLSGLTLNLRHSGYGWLGFVLPHHEARNLGQWLLDNATRQLRTPQQVAVESVDRPTASDPTHSVDPEETTGQPPEK